MDVILEDHVCDVSSQPQLPKNRLIKTEVQAYLPIFQGLPQS
jgi:hypothetical protein